MRTIVQLEAGHEAGAAPPVVGERIKPPIHPGIILLQRYLLPRHITQSALAAHLGISVQRVNEIVRGKRAITPETAWMFAGALGTPPELWMGLQMRYDIVKNKPQTDISLLDPALSECQENKRNRTR